MPSSIEQMHRSYRDRGLVVLAVNIEEARQHVAAWIGSRSITVPVLLDREGVASQVWRVAATPTVFVVGRNGRLVARGSGTRPWPEPPGRAFLDALTAP